MNSRKKKNNAFSKHRSLIFGVSGVLTASAGAFFVFQFILPPLFAISYDTAPASVSASGESVAAINAPTAEHITTPSSVKAIYMSQCVVGTPSFRNTLVALIEKNELNSVVIDIKDYTGKISFTPDDPELADWVSDACGARDMRAFIETLHEKNIYVIGRITVFQDPTYTKAHPELAVQSASRGGPWKDRKGLSFIQVGAKPYWERVVKLSKASYAVGFDELNFDYIRFPSDGDMKDAAYTLSLDKTKPEALEEFFKYLHEQLEGTGIVTSADLFGMTATNTDDLNIGQVLERALPYFDFIDPMVYPSHYPSGFNGYTNVNEHAYDIVHFSLARAVERTIATTTTVAGLTHTRIGTSTPALYAKPAYPKEKIRPWLQDFDYPVEYTPAMVRAQIQATEDAGLSSWLFWDPGNKYSSLSQILSAE